MWHKSPRYRNDVTQGLDTSTNLHEYEEHYDRYNTQHIHQSIEQLKHFFPTIEEVAQAMLDRM